MAFGFVGRTAKADVPRTILHVANCPRRPPLALAEVPRYFRDHRLQVYE
jgi:hypothetical protein